MRILAALLVLLAALGAAATAEAKKKTYCQKVVPQFKKSKVVARSGGVTVFVQGRTVGACSDAKRKALSLYGMDPGYKVAKIAAANKRCLAILMTSRSGNPEILFKDVAGKEIGSTINEIGYQQPAATVGSLSVSTNCAAAWGESVTDAAGTTTYRVRVKSFGVANALKQGLVNEVATVESADDIKRVKAVAAPDKRVKVTWTLAGAPQQAVLPAVG